MNFISDFDAIKPAEHVTYDKPLEGEYKIYVRYFSRKNYDGI
jgi:hypothetical protein